LHFRGIINKIAIWRTLAFGFGCIVFITGSFYLFRQYQTWTLCNLFSQYAKAFVEPLPYKEVLLSDGRVLLKRASVKHNVPDFIVAEFSGKDCGYSTIWPVLRYNKTGWSGIEEFRGDHSITYPYRADWSRSINVNLAQSGASGTRLFFPAWRLFEGIEVPNENVGCFRGLYRVKAPEKLPVLLTVTIPVIGNHAALYQRLDIEDSRIYTIPLNLSKTNIVELLNKKIENVALGEITFKAPILKVIGDRWEIYGYAKPGVDVNCQPTKDRSLSVVANKFSADVSVNQIDTDLLITKPKLLAKGSYFIAHGELFVGGFMVGIIKDGNSAGYINVTRRGPFTAIIKVPEDGLYSIGLANNIQWYTSLENRFIVEKIGWVISPDGASENRSMILKQ